MKLIEKILAILLGIYGSDDASVVNLEILWRLGAEVDRAEIVRVCYNGTRRARALRKTSEKRIGDIN